MMPNPRDPYASTDSVEGPWSNDNEYHLVLTKPGNLLPVVIDREISLAQAEHIIAGLSGDELEDLANFIWERTNLDREWCSNLAKAILERFRQDVEPLTHGTYDPDDDSTKTPERGYP